MEKVKLVKLIESSYSQRQMANELSCSQTKIKYWLKKYNLKTNTKKRKWTKYEMEEAIKNSESIASVLRELGLQVRAGNYDTVKRFIKDNNVNTSHMTGQKHGRGGSSPIALNDILVENSSYSRKQLKKRLLKNGILENKCSIVGCPLSSSVWNDKRLVMVLDHINGINDDNRLENLRMVCPNCNSQLETHCGKNKGI